MKENHLSNLLQQNLLNEGAIGPEYIFLVV